MHQQPHLETSQTLAAESQQPPDVLHIPETLKDWPWSRVMNPHYEEVKCESNAWFKSFKPFNERSQYAFDLCDFGRLAALVYPYASKEHLRTGADLMNIFFLIDEYTDVEPQPVVKEMIDIVLDAIQNTSKPRPEGEIVMGEIARQFWARGEKTATPQAAKHFVGSFTDYLQSVIIQAADRDSDKTRTVEEYFEVRRDNIGIWPSLVPAESHLHIPDHVFYHPAIKELERLLADLVILENDITSYNKEQATGDDRHNILTIVMHQFDLMLPDALEWTVTYHAEIKKQFLDAMKRVPSWGKDVDEQISVYIEHLAGWPRGHDCWSFESGRYFGSKGLEVQKTRHVKLLPRKKLVTHLHKENVAIAVIDSL